MYLDRFPIYEMRTCEPQIVTSNPTPLIVQLKSRRWLSFRCFTSSLCPLMGRLVSCSSNGWIQRKTDGKRKIQIGKDGIYTGRDLSVYLGDWTLRYRNAWVPVCFLYTFMSGLEDFETEEYFEQVVVQPISNRRLHRVVKCENCRTSKVKCQFRDPSEPCSKCQDRKLLCGTKGFPAPDSESSRMKKIKPVLEQAYPVILEICKSLVNPEDILPYLDALSKALNSSSQTTPYPPPTFSSVQQPSPVYPQTMSDAAFPPFTFADNSTNLSMQQSIPHVPGAGSYPASTAPYPLSTSASGTFSSPIVPVPSFDHPQLSFPSNASQQYQYPSPPTYNPSPYYQSLQYPNPLGNYNQSMFDSYTEPGFGNFDENINS